MPWTKNSYSVNQWGFTIVNISAQFKAPKRYMFVAWQPNLTQAPRGNMLICLQHYNPTSQAERDIEPLSCLAAPSKINQNRARHELMPEKGNLTVFQPEVERSVIGHVVPQINMLYPRSTCCTPDQPSYHQVPNQKSDGNIFTTGECCIFRNSFLINQQFV